MIVITGAQRSGTSFMARWFKESGYDLGTDFWDDRIDGGLENPHVCKHFQKLHKDPKFPFSKYWEMIEEQEESDFKDFHTLNTPVVKFSYLLMLPSMVLEWYEKRGNRDVFICMFRPPEDIERSKEMRNHIFGNEDSNLLNLTANELSINRQASLHYMNKLKMRYIPIHFPIVDLDTADRYRQELFEFCHAWLKISVFKELYDPNKVHFK